MKITLKGQLKEYGFFTGITEVEGKVLEDTGKYSYGILIDEIIYNHIDFSDTKKGFSFTMEFIPSDDSVEESEVFWENYFDTPKEEVLVTKDGAILYPKLIKKILTDRYLLTKDADF